MTTEANKVQRGSVCIMTPSRVAIKAVRSVKTQSLTVKECRNAPVALAKHNRISLQWMSENQGNAENERVNYHHASRAQEKIGGDNSTLGTVDPYRDLDSPVCSLTFHQLATQRNFCIKYKDTEQAHSHIRSSGRPDLPRLL